MDIWVRCPLFPLFLHLGNHSHCTKAVSTFIIRVLSFTKIQNIGNIDTTVGKLLLVVNYWAQSSGLTKAHIKDVPLRRHPVSRRELAL